MGRREYLLLPSRRDFEGAQITFGMRGETGAIERVVIDPVTLTPEIEVIGNTTPIGPLV